MPNKVLLPEIFHLIKVAQKPKESSHIDTFTSTSSNPGVFHSVKQRLTYVNIGQLSSMKKTFSHLNDNPSQKTPYTVQISVQSFLTL